MGNIIDSPPEFKDREKVKRKRRLIKEDTGTLAGQTVKRKRRRKMKLDTTEISQYEEVVQSSADDTSNTVVFEETIPLNESEQMYQNSDFLEQKEGYEIVETSPKQGSVLTVLQPCQAANAKVQYIQNQQIVSKSHPSPNGQNALQLQSPPKTNEQFVEQYVSTANIPMQNQIIIQKQSNDSPKSTQQITQIPRNIITSATISQNSGAVLTQSVPGTQQQSPMIFVVPNSGQKKSTEKDVQTVRKPLIINEQKKPIMISKFQTKPETQMTKIKQGVIAQINGQKVLLVPKKKQENIQMSKTTIQKIQPMTVKLATQTSNMTHMNKNIIIQTSAQNRSASNYIKKDTTVKIVSSGATSNANVILTQKKSETYPNLVTSVALTEINPNTVQKTNVPENLLDSKPNILEQALHEVFPTSLAYPDEETFSDVTNQASQDCSMYEEYGANGDLYNPMRSPLKNRNKILCEVLGIDS